MRLYALQVLNYTTLKVVVSRVDRFYSFDVVLYIATQAQNESRTFIFSDI